MTSEVEPFSPENHYGLQDFLLPKSFSIFGFRQAFQLFPFGESQDCPDGHVRVGCGNFVSKTELLGGSSQDGRKC